jgi:phosphonoacetate hydrolase
MPATFAETPFTVNGRTYCPPPRPVVVICLDGAADEYLEQALARGLMPALARIAGAGWRGLARGALPSFTNVNNAAIACGAPPSTTGISGNFFLDPESGAEVMMNSARFLRAETVLAAAARAGRRVALVTAKEKLRDMLARGLRGIAFSAEKAAEAQQDTHGIEGVEELVGRPQPQIYSAEASLYVLDAGAALLERGRADFLYLSTTDFVQHKHAPDTPEALEFHRGIDRGLGRLRGLGAAIGITADHGMNAKNTADGRPKVLYLETLLRERFGDGLRVICPITDPYVVHHGALGSCVMVHASPARRGEAGLVARVAEWLLDQDGIAEVHPRGVAARKLELPEDRIGDLVVLSGRDVALGRRPEDHDLRHVEGGLRSHGGRYEEMVPFMVSEPLRPEYRRRAEGDLRNFEIFEFACNGCAPGGGRAAP